MLVGIIIGTILYVFIAIALNFVAFEMLMNRRISALIILFFFSPVVGFIIGVIIYCRCVAEDRQKHLLAGIKALLETRPIGSGEETAATSSEKPSNQPRKLRVNAQKLVVCNIDEKQLDTDFPEIAKHLRSTHEKLANILVCEDNEVTRTLLPNDVLTITAKTGLQDIRYVGSLKNFHIFNIVRDKHYLNYQPTPYSQHINKIPAVEIYLTHAKVSPYNAYLLGKKNVTKPLKVGDLCVFQKSDDDLELHYCGKISNFHLFVKGRRHDVLTAHAHTRKRLKSDSNLEKDE